MQRSLRVARFLAGAVAALIAVVAISCSEKPLGPASPSGTSVNVGDATDAKPPVKQDLQLNLSHVECVDGKVEVHFVLLFVPDGVTPGDFVTYNWGGGTAQAARGPHTGNVWHYTDYLPSGSTVDIESASVQVNGQTVTLHNPGDYAGTYNCGAVACNFPNPSPGLTCLEHPLGSEADECAYFAPGSTVLGKTDLDGTTGSQQTTMAAAVAIVKDGKAGCSPGQQSYQTYTNVTAGQLLPPPPGGSSISHITYCSCPVPR